MHCIGTWATVLVVALAGCLGGSDDGDDADGTDTTTTSDAMTQTTTTGTTDTTTTGTQTGTNTTTSTTDTTTEPARRDPVTWSVEVQDNAFSPADLSIQVNDTVVWTQTGGNPHTVTADDGEFDSHPDCNSFADSLLGNCMSTDDTFEHTFTSVAEVAYFCRIHGGEGGSGMSGTVSVLERFDETPDGG